MALRRGALFICNVFRRAGTHRSQRGPPRRPIRCRSLAPPPATHKHRLRHPVAVAPAPPAIVVRPVAVDSFGTTTTWKHRTFIQERTAESPIRQTTKIAAGRSTNVPLLCSRARRPFSGGAVTFTPRSRSLATPTFSETFSSFNECVRSF